MVLLLLANLQNSFRNFRHNDL